MHEVRARIDKGGRVLIPAADREALRLRPGDEVVLWLDDGEPGDRDRRDAIRELRDLTRRYAPEGESLTDRLIAERRAEAARER